MADLEVQIGARSYRVACEDGQEPHLAAVADRLRQEAQMLSKQFGILPEARLLLMAGLLVADRLQSVEARVVDAAALTARLEEADASAAKLAKDNARLTEDFAQASVGVAASRAETERALAARACAEDGAVAAREAAATRLSDAPETRAAVAEIEALTRQNAELRARTGASADAAAAAERAALRERVAAAEHRNAVLADQLEAAEGAWAETAAALEDAARRIQVLIGGVEEGRAA
jgi:cell division protein ZapA